MSPTIDCKEKVLLVTVMLEIFRMSVKHEEEESFFWEMRKCWIQQNMELSTDQSWIQTVNKPELIVPLIVAFAY